MRWSGRGIQGVGYGILQRDVRLDMLFLGR